VCLFPCLRESVHSTSDFDVHPVVVCDRTKVVLVDVLFGGVGDVDAHVFIFFHGCSQVEVFQVQAHVFGV
jgi:hypothetical protein